MCVNPVWKPAELRASPLFSPLFDWLARLPETHFPTLEDCNQLLTQAIPAIELACGQSLRFVPQLYGDLPFELQYEPRCYLSGEVATRENNWHDLFNALVWLAFPHSKTVLNARHYQALTAQHKQSGTSQRGVARDVNTLFDESGVVLVSHDAHLLDLVRNFQWKTLFVDARQQWWTEISCYIFGHALYEKALNPYIGMTGQAILLLVEADFWQQTPTQQQQQLDQQLSQHLAALQATRPQQVLSPLPLLGVPGWWPDNQQMSFYDNVNYFRPGRMR